MKFFYLLLLFVFFFSCSIDKKPNPDKNRDLSEVPKINSDLLTPELLWSIGRIGNFQISPDKKQILYDVTWFDIAKNKSFRDLFQISVDGGEPRRLTNTPEKENEEQWRPDGKKIGFIASSPEGSQLFEMNPDGSGKEQITHIKGDLVLFRYSPDLKHILYVKSVKLDKDIHDIFPDLPLANGRLETDLMYRHWDSWHDYTYHHIFVADYNGNGLLNVKDIISGERFDSPMKPFGGMEQVQWDPSGKTIAYTCKKLSGRDYALSTNSDIYLYDSLHTNLFRTGIPLFLLYMEKRISVFLIHREWEHSILHG